MKQLTRAGLTSAGGYILAIALCLAQIGTQLHGAEYGFDDHTHEGVACSIAILQESLDDENPGTLSYSTSISTAHADAAPRPLDHCAHTRHMLPAPRGPPSPGPITQAA